jgi:transposase-like protein
MGKRRTFTPEFKAQVALELLSGSHNLAEICREHELAPQVVNGWRRELEARASEVFATARAQSGEQQRIAELERALGRVTLELEVAKKAFSVSTSLSTRNGR